MAKKKAVMPKPEMHPSTRRIFEEAAERWAALQKQHRVACDMMWAGTLASNFTADELALLSDFLSQNDRNLLTSMARGRPLAWHVTPEEA